MKRLAPALYSASLTTGSLKSRESRIVATLLLERLPGNNWQDAIVRRNVLQTRAPATAVSVTKLLRARLGCFDAPLWVIVKDGETALATQALLACAVKHSALLRDFMDLALRAEYRLFHPTLHPKVWTDFLEACRSRDPAMPEWSESTKARLRSTVFQILAQAGYLTDTRSRKLRPVTILPELIAYLRAKGEKHLIRCLQLP